MTLLLYNRPCRSWLPCTRSTVSAFTYVSPQILEAHREAETVSERDSDSLQQGSCGGRLHSDAHPPLLHQIEMLLRSVQVLEPVCGLPAVRLLPSQPLNCPACPAGPQLLQNGGGVPLRSTQTAKPNLYTLPDCLYTIPASKPCSGPTSVGCSVPGSCTANQLPGGCCQLGFKCT